LDQAESQEDEYAVLLSQARTSLMEAQTEIDEMVEEMAEEEEEVPEVMQIPDELVEIFEDGLEALGDILEEAPEHAEALALEADFYSLMNQPEKAVDSRNKALKSMPEKMEWLHAQAEEMERMEEGDKACALYRRLFALEHKALLEAKNPYGLFFEATEFESMCAKAWQGLEAEIREEGVTLDFSIVCEPMPSKELVEEAIPEEPFDPWTGFHLVIEPRDIGRDLIKITVFQRNVERFWRDSGDVTILEMLSDILADAATPAILLADGNAMFDQE
jgi:tetratricopeptide (TPR) repeat protein